MQWSIALLLFGVFCAPMCSAQANAGPTPSTGDRASIQQIEALITDYAKSVNDLDMDLARRVWSTRSDVTFIHPRGTERGLNAVLENFYQNTMRLFPKRHGRMVRSPFMFYRGAALTMACDLAATPTTSIRVQCCGDAHLCNFGGFATPERKVIFSVNDLDETLPAPWVGSSALSRWHATGEDIWSAVPYPTDKVRRTSGWSSLLSS